MILIILKQDTFLFVKMYNVSKLSRHIVPEQNVTGLRCETLETRARLRWKKTGFMCLKEDHQVES